MILPDPHNIFESQPPDIKLVGFIQTPYDLSVATARTCYSSKGIITPEQVSEDDEARVLRDRIAASTREAGHLTTRQHAHFVFALSGISRSFIWEFLHNHPFYNSEQVSQRYVKVKPGNFIIPQLRSDHRYRYEKIIERQMKAYEVLIEMLFPVVKSEYYQVFPNRKSKEKKWDAVVKKKTYEIARYVLPIATQAYLYHTVSALTLMRYVKVSQKAGVSQEQKYVVAHMLKAVLDRDPDFYKDISEVTDMAVSMNPTRGQNSAHIKSFVSAFDDRLRGRVSLLMDHNREPEKTLAHAVRTLLVKNENQLSDEAAINQVLNPSNNPDLGETLNVMTLSPLCKTLFHLHFTFSKKMSHTADSQNQRHRMTPGSRSSLESHYYGEPDIIYPRLLKEVPTAKKLYDEVIEESVNTINHLLKEGVSFEKASYLLPNGWAVRFEESGDLLNWHHKWKLRTCYNAQEEIFYASMDELKQVAEKFPLIGKHILAPCYIRKMAGLRPFCPEGDRYCGVPVWKQEIQDYQRVI